MAVRYVKDTSDNRIYAIVAGTNLLLLVDAENPSRAPVSITHATLFAEMRFHEVAGTYEVE